MLHSDRSNLESLRSRPKDLPQVLNRLTQLDLLAEATSGKVNREEEFVAECRTHVQTSQRYIQQLQPWIEQAEIYLTKRLDQSGALNLTEAKQLYDRHKVRGNFERCCSFFNHLFFVGISRRTSSNVTYSQ
jgi:hypothetical protein